MTGLGPIALLTMLAAQSPGADSLRGLARDLPESALVLETRARPLAAREAVPGALARDDLEIARRLSSAYAIAWRDSFLLREVARFAAWPPQRRAAKLWVDSVRRAGIAAYRRDGATAAMIIWRRSLARAEGIGDSAGVAAVLGNIGSAFLTDGQLDSAELYLGRARDLAHRLGDFRVEANAVGELAGVGQERGDLAAAKEQYDRALALRDRIGDTRGIAADRNNLGLLAEAAGDLDEARRQFEAALALNRREGRDEVAATNLVNLAGLASLAGEFTRAATLYHDALATWRAKQDWSDAADALHGLGQLELRRGDYPAARTALREALTIYQRTGPLSEALSVRRELAVALAAAGELQGALDLLRRTQRIADSARAPPGVRAGVALARADFAVQLNAPAEASRLYARAEALYHNAGDPEGEAQAQQGRGELLLSRQNFTGAQSLLEAALRTETASGDRRTAALTRLSLGQLARERGDTGTARLQLARAAAELDQLGDPVATAAVQVERAGLEAAAGFPTVAESLYRAGLEGVKDRIAPDAAWRLHAGLGLVRRAQGATEEAAREFRSALAEIDRSSRSLVLAERRSAFLTDKSEVYLQLALTERARARPIAAFEASERLRAREMLDLLARGRVAAPPDTLAELVGREQDLRRRLAELTHELEGDTANSAGLRGTDPVAGPTHDALRRTQDAYAELLLEIRERAPRHAALVSSPTASWSDVARRLAPDQIFVEYLVSDSGSLAFAITPDTIAMVSLGIGRRNLARLVEFARAALEPHPSPQPDSLYRAPLRQLYQYLIAPVEEAGLLSGKTRLVLAPHGELHYLPFAALLDDQGRGAERYLVQRFEITVTPSASVWLALGDRPRARVAAGTLALAPRPEALRATQREVAAIGRFAGADTRILTGSAATEEAFRREAPGRRVLHLATYGVLNKENPLFSYVELAPGGADDGRLEVHEVFGFNLAADLVVLSACQTGLGAGALTDVPPGDDWVGLTRAFLHAGAREVIATLWPVDDRATARLMEELYAALGTGTDPAAALAQAQRALIAAPATASPFYWAGFVVTGGDNGERRGS